MSYSDNELVCSACGAPELSWERELCDTCETLTLSTMVGVIVENDRTEEIKMVRTEELESGMIVRPVLARTRRPRPNNWFTVGEVREVDGSLWVLDSDGYGRNFWTPNDKWEVSGRKAQGEFADNVRSLLKF